MIRRNWSAWVLLVLMAPVIAMTAVFGSAPGGGNIALPIELPAHLITGMILLAVLHAHQGHTVDLLSRGRE